MQVFTTKIHQHLAAGDKAAAKVVLGKAIAAAGGFFLYHELLGDVLASEGERGAAQASYDRALALNAQAVWIAAKRDALLAAPVPTPVIPPVATAIPPAGFVGRHTRYPDLTGKRQAEGGRRLQGRLRESQPGLPLVTIVTAVYDNATSFQRCIDSVLAQSYPNVEYIIVDGGSPQPTLDILAKNAAQIDYYISEPDAGIYAAMNKGIALARGDYICLLNSDDQHDRDFVRRSVQTAQAAELKPESAAVDIVYSDFYDGDSYLAAQSLSPGLYLGNLNINHCTFLVRKSCYDRIGPYSEALKIVSDMVWMRKAYREGMRFVRLAEGYFRFSHGGASSGNSPERRKRIIAENGQCYRADFPCLTQEEAETLYLLRFSNDRLPALIQIARKYPEEAGLRAALASYLEHCLRDRSAFKLTHTEADGKFLTYLEAVELLGVDKKFIRINTSEGCFSEILGRIATLSDKPRLPGSKRVLHYATVFSAASETFIYDLVQRLETETLHENFVLFQQPQLRAERPYTKEIAMPWPKFRPEVSQQIYQYIVRTLGIDLIIAHFAINEHRLHQRILNSGVQLPTIVMTHGVDVFGLKEPSEYSRYVLGDLAQRADVAFTAVSDYLRGELLAVGVATDKITVIPNTVNPVFFRNRKTAGFYDGSRPLRLLCIGRTVDWKGHRFLIEALAQFRHTHSAAFVLTLVYGNGTDELENLRHQVAQLNLQAQVKFEAFVDFAADPSYLAGFDLYIHPSTYSSDATRKSETFGVAVLEAIAAGLPVISTDAGGLPEVLGGGNHPQARLVKHADAAAIAQALQEMLVNPATFSDNRAYAEDRLAAFSAQKQIAALSRLMHQVTGTQIRPALFSSATTQGAGYAAYRVHMGLLRTATVAPTIFTTTRTHENQPGVRVFPHPSRDGNRWRSLQLPAKPGHTIFTVNQTSLRSEALLDIVKDYDVIALHWHARFLSVENIATLTQLGKPVVMTIRDMMPLTGGCHFFHGCDSWQSGCAKCPQIQTDYTDYPAKIQRAKAAHYNFDNLTIVTISTHTRGIVQRSPLFSRCRLETIPNSIETDIFRPYDKTAVRRELGLPLDRQIIGYVPSFSSEVKGYREILAAFEQLQGKLARDPFVMLVGGDTPATQAIRFDKKALGYINDNAKLAQAYSAADVVVVPSLEETFSNTAAEAIACGVPVVGFKTGAIPDLALDGKTGYTYQIGDVVGLARGIEQVLSGPDMAPACRAHATTMLAFMTQARAYEALFHELVARNKPAAMGCAPRIFNLFEEPGFDQIAIAAESMAKKA